MQIFSIIFKNFLHIKFNIYNFIMLLLQIYSQLVVNTEQVNYDKKLNFIYKI